MKRTAAAITILFFQAVSLRPVLASEKNDSNAGKDSKDNNKDTENNKSSSNTGYLSQHDDRWIDVDITGYATISASGCFPTVAAMAVNQTTGSRLTPIDTGSVLHDNGYYGVVRGNLLSVGTFSDAWEFVEEEYDVETEGLEVDEIVTFLQSGGVVAASVNGIFVEEGYAHEILITKADNSGDKVYVMDPNDEEANGWYSLESISSIGSTEWWNMYEGCSFVGIR